MKALVPVKCVLYPYTRIVLTAKDLLDVAGLHTAVPEQIAKL
ncbi:hypothetical protein [Armatimonas sp.]|nr:hypothetical protein [Armatimonas sp.]